jgi:hypothetical protein
MKRWEPGRPASMDNVDTEKLMVVSLIANAR